MPHAAAQIRQYERSSSTRRVLAGGVYVQAMSYVLVHGGGSAAGFWDRLVPFLDQPALAVNLPGRNGKPGDLATLSVDQEAASVVADVEAAGLDDPITLVIHSSGGLVVPGVVAALRPRVRHVLLNAASVPPEGGCGLDCMQDRHREGLAAAFEVADREGRAMTTPGPPGRSRGVPQRLRRPAPR